MLPSVAGSTVPNLALVTTHTKEIGIGPKRPGAVFTILTKQHMLFLSFVDSRHLGTLIDEGDGIFISIVLGS